MIPLFKNYPLLKEKLPYVSLADLPTPILKLEDLGNELGISHLYTKEDGLSAKTYGGNKVRKLEFLLGRALARNTKVVMTFGGAGSNHATATAVHANQIGMRSISMLLPQSNANYVRHNLLMSYHAGAELHLYRNRFHLASGVILQFILHALKRICIPEIIPFGGSSALGTVGFVNAAFELREQVQAGLLPEPDRLYVALGSMGTAVGLALGLKAAGLKTKIHAVRVVPPDIANSSDFHNLHCRINRLLNKASPMFPVLDIGGDDLIIRQEFFGEGYAVFSEAGMDAIRRLRASENIHLEGTYTAKTFAALLHDADNGELKDNSVLFWNTSNARQFSHIIQDIDYRRLPAAFQRYFKEDVQPSDNLVGE